MIVITKIDRLEQTGVIGTFFSRVNVVLLNFIPITYLNSTRVRDTMSSLENGKNTEEQPQIL